ncbi:type VII secretion protein EccB [Amycolatopsis sp. NPDC059021]|uniref:type VII secretion protein EccB n=1 Tax=Amycolatopsis sp. NPDC059021 TaxID=3346704 RepID=UPI00366FBCE9
MRSRRDQVQAHMFIMGRLSAGMLRADPDIPDTPQRRTTRGFAIGIAVTILLGLGTVLFGLIKPGGATSWQQAGTVVVERESGARWIYLGGVLHPVLNQASAKLLAGPSLSVQEVSANSLAGTPRGAPVGIPGAPDGLPAAAALSSAPWLSCAAPGGDGQPRNYTLLVGEAGGRPLTAADGLLVSGPDGAVFLVWSGQKLRLDPAAGGPAALGYGTADPVKVPAGFLNALPSGPDLVAPAVPGRGNAGPALAGRPSRVGQLFKDTAGQPYLLREDGLVPLTPALFALIGGAPETQGGAYGGQPVDVRPIGAGDVTAHAAPPAAKAALTHNDALPDAPPRLQRDDHDFALCAATTSGQSVSTSTLLVPRAVTDAAKPPMAQPGVALSCAGPDRIAIAPGSGVLVRSVSTGDGASDAVSLVADNGVEYPVPTADALKQLGYEGATAVRMPALLAGQLPTGAALDPGAAGKPAGGQTPASAKRC